MLSLNSCSTSSNSGSPTLQPIYRNGTRLLYSYFRYNATPRISHVPSCSLNNILFNLFHELIMIYMFIPVILHLFPLVILAMMIVFWCLVIIKHLSISCTQNILPLGSNLQTLFISIVFFCILIFSNVHLFFTHILVSYLLFCFFTVVPLFFSWPFSLIMELIPILFIKFASLFQFFLPVSLY